MTDYVKVTIYGDKAGSSSLARQLVEHKYAEDYQVARDEGIYSTQVEIDQKTCLIHIFMGFCSSSLRTDCNDQEGFLFVFSIADRDSFKATSKLIDQTKECDGRLPMVLVGNKCDLEHLRVVPTSEGAALAESVGCTYLETSAKAGINVDACFFELVREVRKLKPETNLQDKGPKGERQCLLS